MKATAEIGIGAGNPVSAHSQIARYLIRQGEVSKDQNAAAGKLYEWALELEPGNIDAINGTGRVAVASRRMYDAYKAFSVCLKADPNNPAYLSNMAVVQYNLGNMQECQDLCDRAIALDSFMWSAWHQKAVAYRSCEEYDKALSCVEAAIAIDPMHPDLQVSLGFSRFSLNDWAGGWKYWEFRSGRSKIKAEMSGFRAAEWTGAESLDGKTLLVFGEDGLGDQIMFARWMSYLPSGGNILFAPTNNLVRLLSGIPGVSSASNEDVSIMDVDYWIAGSSLPHVLKMPMPPAPVDLSRFRDTSDSGWPIKIGLAWKGNPGTPIDWRRPHDLSLWKSALSTHGQHADIYSLQHGSKAPDWMSPLPYMGDMQDMAEHVGRMDLVITADTSVAHLAASIGVPTWMLLYRPPEWRWVSGWTGDRSVWYPNMRVFTQKVAGEWGPVFDSVSEEISKIFGFKA